MASERPGPETATPQRCSVAYFTDTVCCGKLGSRTPAVHPHSLTAFYICTWVTTRLWMIAFRYMQNMGSWAAARLQTPIKLSHSHSLTAYSDCTQVKNAPVDYIASRYMQSMGSWAAACLQETHNLHCQLIALESFQVVWRFLMRLFHPRSPDVLFVENRVFKSRPIHQRQSDWDTQRIYASAFNHVHSMPRKMKGLLIHYRHVHHPWPRI